MSIERIETANMNSKEKVVQLEKDKNEQLEKKAMELKKVKYENSELKADNLMNEEKINKLEQKIINTHLHKDDHRYYLYQTPTQTQSQVVPTYSLLVQEQLKREMKKLEADNAKLKVET